MDNKKINLLFNLVVIFFLALTFILIRELNANRAIDYKEYFVTLGKIVKEKNNKIRTIYSKLVAEEQVNADLKITLAQTRSDLDALSKKLAQPAPVVVPVSVPAAATATK